MNSGRNDRQRISRRVVLTGTALALGATATVVSRTAAQVKISQATANYQDTPKGIYSCGLCTLFERPNGCKVVEGEVNKDGWCNAFAMAD